MKAKLLRRLRERVVIYHNTKSNKYKFVDEKINVRSGGIYEEEFESKSKKSLKSIKNQRREYILGIMHDVYNECIPFWRKEKYRESEEIKLGI